MSDLISGVDYTIFRHRNVGESAPPRATSHASMAAVAIANGKAPLRGRVGQTRKGARNRKGDRLMISPSLGSSGRSMRGNTQKPLRLKRVAARTRRERCAVSHCAASSTAFVAAFASHGETVASMDLTVSLWTTPK